MNRETRRRLKLGKRLLVLPPIEDDWSPELKNAVAARNTATATGTCPECGATAGTPKADGTGVLYAVIEHASWCPTLDENLRRLIDGGGAV